MVKSKGVMMTILPAGLNESGEDDDFYLLV